MFAVCVIPLLRSWVEKYMQQWKRGNKESNGYCVRCRQYTEVSYCQTCGRTSMPCEAVVQMHCAVYCTRIEVCKVIHIATALHILLGDVEHLRLLQKKSFALYFNINHETF